VRPCPTTLARVSVDAVPFLWLCGPSGVGKTTVGWEIFSQLDRAGIPVGYLDADQIGLCYPELSDDGGNQRLKARNLGALWPNYRAAGVRCFVFSGGVDTAERAAGYVAAVPGAAVTVCRLRVDHAELRARLIHRGLSGYLDDYVDEADALDRSDFADLCVDTGGRSVVEVARLVRAEAGGWPCLIE
jgi:hypothetical protein